MGFGDNANSMDGKRVVLPPMWWLIGLCAVGMGHSIYLEWNDITLYRDYTPNWILIICLPILAAWAWKSMEFDEEGFTVSRCFFFRKRYSWANVFQVVETTLKTGKYERIVMLIVLDSIRDIPFAHGADANYYVSRNRKHIIVCETGGHTKWERVCELRELIESCWGKIE